MFGLFEKIPIPFRFLGIGALFTLLFLWHIFFDLTNSLIEEKRLLQTRLKGLEYLKTSRTQVAALQKLRGLNHLYLEGERGVADEIRATESQIKRNFVVLSDFGHPIDAHGCNEKLNEIRHRLERQERRFELYRHSGATEGQKAGLFKGYSEIIEHLLYFNSYIAVTYNIGESADWHLFVLSELLSERIPLSLEVLAKLRGITSGTIQHGRITPEEREQLYFYIRLLTHNRVIIQSKLQHIFEHDTTLKTRIKPHFDAVIRSNQQLVKTIETYLTRPDSITVDGQTFFDMATGNMGNAMTLLTVIHDNLEKQIRIHAQSRIDALRMKIYVESLLLVAGLALFWFFYLSSMGYIRKIENAEKAKAVFLSHMSHEIRTPLNAILGFIGILKEKIDESESLKYIETIQKSSTLLLNIINDILDLSKIESGKLSIEAVAFHPRIEFNPIIMIYAAKATEKGIAFHTMIDPEVPKCVSSDPVRLKQILSNLLSNAIKFTPEKGSITLRIGFDEHAYALKISVADTGIGIPAAKQKKVFEAFTQAEESTTRHYGGTGLGLAICAKLVSMMNGQITLESSVGKGSTFSLIIPLPPCTACIVEYDEEVLTRHRRMVETVRPQRFSGNVLLVEDNETNQIYMELLLKKMGLTYEIAQDGLEAVELFKSGHYNLVLMDENMPRMNGTEAAKVILRLEKEENRPHTPIIAITANALQGDRDLFLEAGMDGYLSKPVDKAALTAVFESYLKKENLIHYPIKSFQSKEQGSGRRT